MLSLFHKDYKLIIIYKISRDQLFVLIILGSLVIPLIQETQAL